MIYCDTSLLVSALTTETGSLEAQAWLRENASEGYAISRWVDTEMVSALAMKRRRGALSAANYADTLAEWRRSTRRFDILQIDEGHFTNAARLIDMATNGLRSSDALHLAIVVDHGCDLATLDRDLADAATALGVGVHPQRLPRPA